MCFSQLQVKEGIDAVIVDSVLAIRKGLTHPADPAKESSKEADEKGFTINGVPVTSFIHGAVV